MNSVFALDLATCTGWAIDNPTDDGRPVTGTFVSPSPSGDKEGGREYGETFSVFRRWLTEQLAVHKPRSVAFEAPLNRIRQTKDGKPAAGESTVRLLFGLATVAEMTAYESGALVYEENLMTIKKQFAGHGHADKGMMIARCRQLRWDVGNDDDRADAAALWWFVKANQDKKWALRATPLFAGQR